MKIQVGIQKTMSHLYTPGYSQVAVSFMQEGSAETRSICFAVPAD